MTTKQQPKHAGFSLVEVMISMTILTIVFAAAFSALYTANLIHHDSAKRAVANQIIQFEVENIRSLNWTQVSAFSSSSVDIITDSTLDDLIANEFNNSFNLSRSATPATDDNGIISQTQQEITLTASWTGNRGKQVSISTLITYSKDGMSERYFRTYN